MLYDPFFSCLKLSSKTELLFRRKFDDEKLKKLASKKKDVSKLKHVCANNKRKKKLVWKLNR